MIDSKHIAEIAGLSRSTVSRVINNYPNVPEKTKERVLNIIKEYNYTPNLSAQALKGKKTNTIGMFFFTNGVITDNLLNSFYIASVIENAALYGYHVLSYIIRDTSNEDTIKTVKDVFRQQRIDGGIFKGMAKFEPLLEELIEEGFFISTIDLDFKGRDEKNLCIVNFECEKTATNSIDYVVGLNHRKIAVLNGNTEILSGIQRNNGFLKGIEKNRSKIDKYWIIPGAFSRDSGHEQMRELLKSSAELPTAICAANDSIAFGAITAINEFGLKVPYDISVIGIDDHILSQYFTPPLTTFKIDFSEMYKNATLSLIALIEHRKQKQPVRLEYESRLVERDSCRAI